MDINIKRTPDFLVAYSLSLSVRNVNHNRLVSNPL